MDMFIRNLELKKAFEYNVNKIIEVEEFKPLSSTKRRQSGLEGKN